MQDDETTVPTMWLRLGVETKSRFLGRTRAVEVRDPGLLEPHILQLYLTNEGCIVSRRDRRRSLLLIIAGVFWLHIGLRHHAARGSR
jgi:hypothetical protein